LNQLRGDLFVVASTSVARHTDGKPPAFAVGVLTRMLTFDIDRSAMLADANMRDPDWMLFRLGVAPCFRDP
jgi:hypothetical protein